MATYPRSYKEYTVTASGACNYGATVTVTLEYTVYDYVDHIEVAFGEWTAKASGSMSSIGKVKVVASNNTTVASEDYGRAGFLQINDGYLSGQRQVLNKTHSSTADSSYALYVTGYTDQGGSNDTVYAYKGFYVQIPALDSWTVTYHNNLIASSTVTQTKWYDETPALKGQEAFPREGFRIKEWNTSANGSGTSYAIGATYSSNSDLELYAIWTPWVESVVINDVTAVRTATSDGTVESDEGAYAYVNVPFTIKCGGEVSYNVSVVLMPDVGGVSTGRGAQGGITSLQPMGSDPICNTNNVNQPFYYSEISPEASYSVSVTVYVRNVDYTSQPSVSVSRTARIPTAYHTMDVLGDGWYYNKTTDTSVVSGKTYYEQDGDGTPESPYEYTPVSNPIPSGLENYYEANGLRPGYGISFGAPASREGFNVSMPSYYYGQAITPVCVQTTAPSRTDMLWLDTSSTSARLKYHNGSAWTPLPSVWG